MTFKGLLFNSYLSTVLSNTPNDAFCWQEDLKSFHTSADGGRDSSQNLLSLRIWAQISVEIIDCTLASSETLAPQADKFWPQVAHQALLEEAETLVLCTED